MSTLWLHMIALMVSHFSHCLVHGLVVLHLHFNMPSTVSMARLSLWTLLGCISDTGWWARGASDFMMILCICENSMMLTGAHNSWTLPASWSIKSSWEFPHVHGSHLIIWSTVIEHIAGWDERSHDFCLLELRRIKLRWIFLGGSFDDSHFNMIHQYPFPLSSFEPSNTMQNFTNNFKASANVTFTSLKNWKI